MKKGWELRNIGNLCEIGDGNHGGNYPTKSDLRDSGIPFIRGVNLVNGEISSEDLRYISIEKHESLNKGHLKTGDVLFTNRGDIGKCAIVSSEFDDANLNSQIAFFRCSGDLYNRYLFYFLQSPILQSHLAVSKTGAALQQFTIGQILKLAVPVPPLEEQQRIVALLDETFSALDTVHANVENNLHKSQEIFTLYLQNAFNSVTHKWGTKELGDLSTGVEYGSSAKSQKTGKVPVLRMGNIQKGRFDWDDLVYTSDEDEIKKYSLKHNDVLFNRTNSLELVGKTAIYKSEMPAVFAGYLIRIHRKEDLIDADYLNYFLNSDIAKQYGRTVVISSVNQANINGQKLKTYPVPLPPLAEQRAIATRLDELSKETKRLEAIYQCKVEQVEELRKSILQKAFEGGL